MKKLSIITLIILLTASLAFAVPPSPPSSGVSAYTDVTALWTGTGLLYTDGTVKAIGTDVQAYYAILSSIGGVGAGEANQLLGYNNSGTLGWYSNHTHDDSAAQFYSATASKGTMKFVQSSINNGILVTVTPVASGNATFTNDTVGAGTYKFVFKETDNTFTGANTIGDGGDDQRIVSRINATNERWSGHTIYFAQCAASLAFGTPVYIQSTGKPAGADADAAATMPAIGLIVVASTDADTPCTVLTHGVITDTDWNWTPGATLYVSETVGSVENTLSNISDTNDVVQVIGIAVHADSIFVNPSLTTVVLE